MDLDVEVPTRVERWRPLILWLLVIPHLLVSSVFGLAAEILVFLGWFAALFTGRLPDSFGRFITGALRYQWRVSAYLYGLSTVYPAFSLPAGDLDPGGDMATITLSRSARLSRVKVFFRALLAIPQIFVLYFVGLAAGLVSAVAWFAVIITGRWPEGMRRFFVGYYRWTMRVNAYLFLLVDDYPPFSLT